jgi:hypothetical protein
MEVYKRNRSTVKTLTGIGWGPRNRGNHVNVKCSLRAHVEGSMLWLSFFVHSVRTWKGRGTFVHSVRTWKGRMGTTSPFQDSVSSLRAHVEKSSSTPSPYPFTSCSRGEVIRYAPGSLRVYLEKSRAKFTPCVLRGAHDRGKSPYRKGGS